MTRRLLVILAALTVGGCVAIRPDHVLVGATYDLDVGRTRSTTVTLGWDIK